MKYYKQIKDNKITAYLSGCPSVESDDLTEITEDEYNEAIQALREEAEKTAAAVREQTDARISALENENAGQKNELVPAKISFQFIEKGEIQNQ